MSSRLENLYKEKIRPELLKEIGFSNPMQVPRMSKVVLNIGVKEAVSESKVLNSVKEVLTEISGQTPVITKAKKSIAGFKLRKGMPLGVMVTLRGNNMYSFIDRLINLALPRVKDFQGVKESFDGNGNYNLGIRDWMIFPEVDYEKVDRVRGLNITIETSTNDDKAACALLKGFNMPFQRK
ncbi:50S ribosomal protein L5 [Candidatus Babeliales bacterium]|nr:50S ribosomal protein L5 [Candidatus Babeliales bacterium]